MYLHANGIQGPKQNYLVEEHQHLLHWLTGCIAFMNRFKKRERERRVSIHPTTQANGSRLTRLSIGVHTTTLASSHT